MEKWTKKHIYSACVGGYIANFACKFLVFDNKCTQKNIEKLLSVLYNISYEEIIERFYSVGAGGNGRILCTWLFFRGVPVAVSF